MIYLDDPDFTLHVGDVLDVLAELPDESVDCVVTSPPYFGLRDYGVEGQIGLEASFHDYIVNLVNVFAEVRRVLSKRGVVWLNMGDSYASKTRGSDLGWEKSRLRNPGDSQKRQAAALSSHGGDRHRGKRDGFKDKDLMMVPHRLAIALQDDGWWVRSDVVWDKPNCMPESATDRPTKSHEYVFLLSKSLRYFYDEQAVREALSPVTLPRVARASHLLKSAIPHRIANPKAVGDTRNLRSVWRIASKGFKGAHFATYPEELVERCILSGCPIKVCTGCGKPRTRDVEVTYVNPGNRTTNGPRSVERRHETAGFSQRLEKRTRTAGFSDCGCGAPFRQGVVLDPFIGSGTTALVARRLGRRSIGIELNPEYAAMCADRLSTLQLLLPEAV